MANCWFCYKEAPGKQYHSECCEAFFSKKKTPELLLDKQLLKALAEKNIHQKIAITGVQPKLSVALDTMNDTMLDTRLAVIGLSHEYILKPQHPFYHLVPENEDLTMHLAALFGIQVCEHTLLQATDRSLVYVAKRLDRKGGQKIHMEDFCQLSSLLTENKYKGSYERIGKLIAKYCTNEALELLSYFEVLLFSYLTGNNDMHLKNFSVLHLHTGIVLSPAYDLLNINMINPADEEELALTLNAKKKRIKLKDFIMLADGLSIPENVRNNIFSKFSSMNDKVYELINSSFLDEEGKEKYKKIWLRKQQIFN
ncbi:MAG: HipA domain-containing protein [Chitinophaga sp.]|uniref:HipA domain-containing protein n=1 Tax=Chitinophaga sp. TaxID=1869181 RepID=UPI001B030ADB|nr:HipA domain-containing protein [Chitinophaga sp.]MBO9731663.1 HipA domain-containing protein [Chitinophaga sp.]